MFLFKIYKTFPIPNPVLVCCKNIHLLVWRCDCGEECGLGSNCLHLSPVQLSTYLGSQWLCAWPAHRAQGYQGPTWCQVLSAPSPLSPREKGENKPDQQCHYHRPVCIRQGPGPRAALRGTGWALGGVTPVPSEGSSQAQEQMWPPRD